MSQEVALDERLLPQNMKRMIKAVGIEPTLKLLKALGGTRVSLPKRVTPNDPIATIIGLGPAKKLVEEFKRPYLYGSEQRVAADLTLPKSDKIAMQIRDAAILASDEDARSLALRYDLTTRQVQNIRANRGAWPRWRKGSELQAELFPGDSA